MIHIPLKMYINSITTPNIPQIFLYLSKYTGCDTILSNQAERKKLHAENSRPDSEQPE